MKSYLGMFKMSFKGELQYRAKAFSGILTQIFYSADGKLCLVRASVLFYAICGYF